MIVITSNEKLKEETFIHHHLLQLKLPFLQGEFCPHQIIQIIFFNFFFAIKQMRQLITISFKLYHQINVRGKWRKGQLIPSYWQSSKFTEGDVIATEAKYHRNCLARLCNVSFEYISKNRKCNCLFLQNQHYKINNS